MFAWKTPKMNKKEVGGGPFRKYAIIPKVSQNKPQQFKILKNRFSKQPENIPKYLSYFCKPRFVYFRPFQNAMTIIVKNYYYWKKHRWYAQGFEPGATG